MKIILRQDIPALGSLGDEIEVKRGYARNYLVPQGYAYVIERKTNNVVTAMIRQLVKKRDAAINDAQVLAKQLEAQVWTMEVEAGESGKLHGAVTTRDIRDLLLKGNIEIDRKLLAFSPIKDLGSYSFSVKLHTQVVATLQVKLTAAAKENAGADAKAEETQEQG